MQNKQLQREIGKRVRDIRKKFEYSQEQMAEMLEVSLTQYKNLEGGRRGFSADHFCKLNRIFSVSTDYIIIGADAESTENPDRAFLKAVHDGADENSLPYIVAGTTFAIKMKNLKTGEEMQEMNSCPDGNK